MTTKEFFNRINQYSNYLIIIIATILAVFFFPFIGSTIGLQLNLPNTVAGWIVFVVTKLCVGGINLLIFHCFTAQAKINVRDNVYFKEAEEILRNTKLQEYKPLSPKQFFAKEYGIKGASIFLTSVLAAFSLAQAILTFDIVTMLTYLATIIMGTIAGFFQMKKVEEFWTIDYWNYAKEKEKELNSLNGENSQ